MCACVCVNLSEEREKGRPRLPRLLCLQRGGGATAMHQNQGERGCKSEGVSKHRTLEESKEKESKLQKKEHQQKGPNQKVGNRPKSKPKVRSSM